MKGQIGNMAEKSNKIEWESTNNANDEDDDSFLELWESVDSSNLNPSEDENNVKSKEKEDIPNKATIKNLEIKRPIDFDEISSLTKKPKSNDVVEDKNLSKQIADVLPQKRTRSEYLSQEAHKKFKQMPVTRIHHKCDICEMTFGSPSRLTIHVNAIHERNKNFKRNNKNELKHINLIKHKCDMCDSSFKGKEELLIHEGYSHNKYSCGMCDKVFLEIDSLDKHITFVHLNLTKLQCDLCEKSFVFFKDLNDHKKLEHDIKEYQKAIQNLHKAKDLLEKENADLKSQNGVLKLEKLKVDEFEKHQKDLTKILSIPTNASFSKVKEEIQAQSKVVEMVHEIDKYTKESGNEISKLAKDNQSLRQTIENGLEKLKSENLKVHEFENHQKDMTNILGIASNASFSKIKEEVKNLRKKLETENFLLRNINEENLKKLEAKNKEIENFEKSQQEMVEILSLTNESSFPVLKQELKNLKNIAVPTPCDHSKLNSEILELKQANEDLEKRVQDAKNIQLANIKLESEYSEMGLKVQKLDNIIYEKEEKLNELNDKIDQRNQKLFLQKGKCDEFETQQNILIALLNVPNDQRNFLGLRENVENLKQDYINEKERADALAMQMPMEDTNSLNVTTCDHTKLDSEILELKHAKENLEKKIVLLKDINSKLMNAY